MQKESANRTLIYTACTRAKERLLITGVGKLVEQLPLYNGLCKANFPLDNSTNQKAAIQVEDKISERIVEDTVFPVATNTKVKITEVSDKPTPQPQKPSLKVKQKVAHIKYGEGIVEEVRGNYISILFGNYLETQGEVAAFAVLPSVLKRGVEVGAHANHKGREYGTVTFAAPVEINGVRGNMAATVIQTNANHYKTHRILMPDGSSFVYNNKEVTVGTRVYGDDTSAAPTITRVTSESIVAENPEGVKFSPRPTDIRYQQRDAEDDKAYVEEAKAHFGKTYSYNKAGYIVTDGSMLDFSGKHEGYDSGARSVDHREIWEVREPDDMSGTEAMIDFMAAGNIRLSPESGGFNLIVAPTKAQEYTLSNYISKFRGEVIVDIDNERGETIHSFEYNRGTHSSRVLNDLRAYFEDGTLPAAQSNLAQFLYQQRDPDQISDRELLATALQSVTQNADEWDNLQRYQKKIAALNEKQRMLEQRKEEIHLSRLRR